ncbi:hypothetical protein PGSY75_0620300 [Plasmodium gaboni]|uniref:Uncharacterized protein n=1 Tax=Plasmodium gaboni TaxID=647221 RepID=A0A151LRW2_9APIC|nr:hypothetical protein PGSY75_0620300 [Plasmodium gaboni]KYO01897.1 hypothetical protein PGSY75_0620300 [Plasmodium gaboni]
MKTIDMKANVERLKRSCKIITNNLKHQNKYFIFFKKGKLINIKKKENEEKHRKDIMFQNNSGYYQKRYKINAPINSSSINVSFFFFNSFIQDIKEYNKLYLFNKRYLGSNILYNQKFKEHEGVNNKHIGFEDIIRILKSLTNVKYNNKVNYSLEKKVILLLPHIYEECRMNYVHMSCIVYNFHKLKNKISNEYKKGIYNEFNKIFVDNINQFSLKELIIILKCLLEEKCVHNDKIITYCIFKFIYYMCMDILYYNKNENFSLNFLNILTNGPFKEYIKNYFILNINSININDDINWFYNFLCNNNLNEDHNKNISHIVDKMFTSKFINTFFTLHDIATFLNLLKIYNNLKGLQLYTFLSHIYISFKYINIVQPFYEHIEENFLSYERGEKLYFSKKGNMKNEIIDMNKYMIERNSDNLEKKNIMFLQNISKNMVSIKDDITYYIIHCNDNKDNTNNICKNSMRENMHSLSVIIYLSIKNKMSNKFLYILGNYLLLQRIEYINLMDICNIFDLLIYNNNNNNIYNNILCQDKYLTIFTRIKNLIIKEKSYKSFPICCISITRAKNELSTHFNHHVINIFKIILKKINFHKIYRRENIVIFINIANFIKDQKVSALFYFYYLKKFAYNFLKTLIDNNEINNSSTYQDIFINIIDLYDILKTFTNILKIYEKNNYFDVIKKKDITLSLNLCMEYILQFLEKICFNKIIKNEDNYNVNKLKILNEVCFHINSFLVLFKKIDESNKMHKSTKEYYFKILKDFKRDILNYHKKDIFTIISDTNMNINDNIEKIYNNNNNNNNNTKKKKNVLNIFNFLFTLNGYNNNSKLL